MLTSWKQREVRNLLEKLPIRKKVFKRQNKKIKICKFYTDVSNEAKFILAKAFLWQK